MRKTNRIISLILAVSMMLALAIPMTASAALTFNDLTSDHHYYEAITKLTADGIINGFDDGSFKPEDLVTRAQFTKIICYAQGAGNLTYTEESRAKFPDVDPNHWAIHNITTAQQSGIINGYDDGTFRPEQSVLYEQAVKMAVCALGYTEDRAKRATPSGRAYPDGYMKLANDAGILKRINDGKQGEALSRGGVAQLIDNMLDAEIYDPDRTAPGGETMRDQVFSGKETADGRIVAVYGTSIYADEESQCHKTQIELEYKNGDREFFGIEEMDIEDLNLYLGRSVTVYYEKESGAEYYEAYNIVFQKNKNYEVTVNLEQIESYTRTEIEYYSEKTKDVETMKIASRPSLIHNGQTRDVAFDDILDTEIGKTGYITLVCSQSEEVADVVFVRTYETIIVKSKDSTNYKIYALGSGSAYTLNPSDRNKTITFKKNGSAATFSNISTNDVVSISTSANGALIDVQISNKKQAGSVSEVDLNGAVKLSTSSTYYKLTANCMRDGEIVPGIYVTLYLDAFGKVARYVVTAEKTYTFGYMAAAENTGTNSEPKIEVMVYKMSASNATPERTIYKLKETVKIDGRSYRVSEDADEIMDIFETAAAASGINATIGSTVPTNANTAQPIRFTTSASDVIDQLLTINATGSSFSTTLNLTKHTTTPVACTADKTTLGKYTIGSNVPILVVPSDRVSGTYTTKTHSYFEKGESYYVQLVNVDLSNKPQAIYVYGTATGGADAITTVLSEDDIPMIVKEVTPKAFYEDQTRIRLKLLGVDGQTYEAYDDDREGTEVIADVVVGDVIRVALDDKNLINAIEVVAVAANVVSGSQPGAIAVDGTNDSTDRNAPYRTILGLVHNVDGSNIVIAPSYNPADTAEETHTYKEGVKVYLVDTANERNPVTACDFGEVKSHNQHGSAASKLMVYTVDGEEVAMIIFR